MPQSTARLLLFLLHQAYRCYLALLAVNFLCYNLVKQLWTGNVDQRGVCAPAGLISQTQLPGKRPIAVALIVGWPEARDCLVDLQRVLALCHDVGVEHVAVYDAAGEIKAACHQILAGVPSSDSLMGGISGHNQGRQTRNGWGSRCKTEASGPDGHHSPMTHGAPRGNGAVQRQEWCQEPPCGVSLARCGGECGCSGEAKGGLQEGAGCRQNGGSEGGWDNMEEKGGAKSSRGMGASEHGRANSYASGGFSRSAQMESAFPMEASGSRTPILRWTYNPAQALPDLSESSERVDSGLPALESVNSRLCPPRHTEVPAQRVGTTGCEQDQDRDKVGRRRDPVSHQTVSSELRSRHLGIDTSRNGRKLEHRLSERTAMRVNEGHSDGVGKVPRLVNGIHEQRGSTTGSNGVSLHADVGEKCRTLRLERTRLMTVDFLSEADGKGALGRAAERICWDAWHGTHMPSGVVENGHGSQAPDREERGKGGAAEGIRRLEEEDIDRALAATGGVTREPELVLVCGKVLTLAGFPPWLLRNSEIVHIPSLRGVTAACFKRALEDFARRTQRFGK